jgi:hypothetical protein
MRKFFLHRIYKHSDRDEKTQSVGVIVRSRMSSNVKDHVPQQLPRNFIPVLIQNKSAHTESQYFYVIADHASSFLPEIGMIIKICFIFQKRHDLGDVIERLPFKPLIKHGQKRDIYRSPIPAKAENINACIIMPVFQVSFLKFIPVAISTAYRYKCSFDDITC